MKFADTKIQSIVSLFALLFICCQACKFDQIHENFDISNAPLTAAFEIDSIGNNGFDPSSVIFKNTSVNADAFEWNFGDPASGADNNSNEKDPTHLYQNPGVYTIRLTATNTAAAESKSVTANLTIQATKTFTRTESGRSRALGAILASDGSYIVVGSQSEGKKSRFDRFSVDGFRLSGFPKTFGDVDNNEFIAVTRSNSGDIAVAGYQNESGSFNGARVTFYLMDEDGNVNGGFPKILDIEGGVPADLIATANGGYGIVGSSSGNGGGDFMVTLLDANGNQIAGFPRNYNEFDFTETAVAIQQLDNGEYVIIGSDVTLFRVWIHRMDANGNDIAGYPIYKDNLNADDCDILPDGSIICVGRSDFGLLRFDLNGNDFPSFPRDFGNDFRGRAILYTKEGDLVFTGQQDNDLVLYRTDLNGNSLPGFPKTFPASNGNETIGNAILQTEDGGFFMAGTSGTFSNERIYLVKTDSNGDVR